MSLHEALRQLARRGPLAAAVTFRRLVPASPGSTAAVPAWLHPALSEALDRRAMTGLWSHQAEALENIHAGRDTVLATPTASGKTLVYNLAVLDALLRDPEARALYVFPTKALGQDQVRELGELARGLPLEDPVAAYDGDTPAASRARVRGAARVVATNPDMLHAGILPNHPAWSRFFRNLRFVVLDEIHQYRGVFGSHAANVLRRLGRVASRWGARPLFIGCSATIANPGEHAARLTGREAAVVDRSGAPSGPRHFIFYNPPLVNRELGLRSDAGREAVRLAALFLEAGVQTIIFAGSRLETEVILSYLREAEAGAGRDPTLVRGYRGGYLPRVRREIERGLKDGRIRAVVATNALELGVDIGTLEASIMVGYPGTIAAAWQQAGRAGRRAGDSAAVLVADGSAHDQFIVRNPLYFFGRSPEHAVIDPDNPAVLLPHLRCAAFELPLADGESFGGNPVTELAEYLAEEGSLLRAGERWHWSGGGNPAAGISLRSASSRTVAIRDLASRRRVIGRVDEAGAPLLLHPEAVYIQEGRSYLVRSLDLERSEAEVEPFDSDWFTRAESETFLEVLESLEDQSGPRWSAGVGEVSVRTRVTSFRRLRFHTHEDLGSGPVSLPETEMRTTSFWVRPEAGSEGEDPGALRGLMVLLLNVAPLFLMADPRDLRGSFQAWQASHGGPVVFIWDNLPGGVGYSRQMLRLFPQVLEAAGRTLRECSCAEGCPACIGPPAAPGAGAKVAAARLLERLMAKPG